MKKIEAKRMSKKEFIKMIDKIYPDDAEIDVHVINFDQDQKVSIKDTCNKNNIEIIADESKTIIYRRNNFFSHIDLHSAYQADIVKVKPIGIMKTILLREVLKE